MIVRHFEVMRRIATTILAVILAIYVIRQCRKPTGRVGQLIAKNMNSRHRALTDWALDGVAIERDHAVLDVGCGGGATVRRFAGIVTAGKAVGVDYSKDCVAASISTNAEAIRAGRAWVVQASVSQLPFPEGSFNLATAIETFYYWPDPVSDLREVRRVLAPGGTVVIAVEAYKGGGGAGAAVGAIMKLLGGRALSANDHADILAKAGFVDVHVRVDPRRGWLCATGRK